MGENLINTATEGKSRIRSYFFHAIFSILLKCSVLQARLLSCAPFFLFSNAFIVCLPVKETERPSLKLRRRSYFGTAQYQECSTDKTNNLIRF